MATASSGFDLPRRHPSRKPEPLLLSSLCPLRCRHNLSGSVDSRYFCIMILRSVVFIRRLCCIVLSKNFVSRHDSGVEEQLEGPNRQSLFPLFCSRKSNEGLPNCNSGCLCPSQQPDFYPSCANFSAASGCTNTHTHTHARKFKTLYYGLPITCRFFRTKRVRRLSNRNVAVRFSLFSLVSQ